MKLRDSDVFVAYSLPGFSDFELVIDKSSEGKNEFVFAPFLDTDHKSLSIHFDQSLSNQRFTFYPEKTTVLEETNKLDYMEVGSLLVDSIRDNKLQKAILSRVKSKKNDNIDLYHLFQLLISAYPNAFVYVFNHPESGTWMGATPELLLEKNHRGFKTVALAGTQKAGGQSLASVDWGSKEIAEQKFIENYLKEIFDRLGISYQTSPTETVQAGNVYHIQSIFRSYADKDAAVMAKEIHPGPAISGYPASKALSFIQKYEPHDRRYYCGYMGLQMADGTSQYYVNLRCMEVFQNLFLLYAGGGYTVDSNPEKEWIETDLKINTLLSIIEKSYIYADDIQ